jgi:hypothetical protein
MKIHDYCSYCDFKELDDDPQDCTCEEYCGEESCSGEPEGLEPGELSGDV